MNEHLITCGWIFLLVFGSLFLCLCLASAHVSGKWSDEERREG